MIRYLLIIFVCAFLNTSAQEDASPVSGFTIAGTIGGLPDNSLVFLTGGNTKDTLAKAIVKNNGFVLKGMVANEDGHLLVMPAVNKSLFIFFGNDNISLTSSSPAFADLQIQGSATQKDFEDFLQTVQPAGMAVNSCSENIRAATTITERDSLYLLLNASYQQFQRSVDDYIQRKNNSPVAALTLVFSYEIDPNRDIMLLEKRYNLLDSNARRNQYAKSLESSIAIGKIGAVGTRAISFSQKDTLGKVVSLSQFSGKYLLIDFWASWCGPCRRENPKVVEAYHAFKNKNFTILSVSLDQSKTSWLNAIHQDNLAWTHVSDLKYWSNEVAQLYRVQSIPQNFLVDPSGTIIAKNLRGEDLAATLSKLIK